MAEEDANNSRIILPVISVSVLSSSVSKVMTSSRSSNIDRSRISADRCHTFVPSVMVIGFDGSYL